MPASPKTSAHGHCQVTWNCRIAILTGINSKKPKNLVFLYSIQNIHCSLNPACIFFFNLRSGAEQDNNHNRQLFERTQGTQLFPLGLDVSPSPCAGTAPLRGLNSPGAALTAHTDRRSTAERILWRHVCCFKGDSVPAPRLSAKSLSVLQTPPSRSDVLVLSSYLLFL